MREAAVPGYRLSKAKFSTRVLTSLGLFGILLGLLFSTLLTVYKIGIWPNDVRTYYLGASGGDSLDQMLSAQPRPLNELAEVTHLHLMGGSLMLFLLCHLLALCDVKDRTRTFVYVTAFSTFLLAFGSPWLLIFVHPAFSVIFGPSMIGFIIMLFICAAIPLREMWLGRTR